MEIPPSSTSLPWACWTGSGGWLAPTHAVTEHLRYWYRGGLGQPAQPGDLGGHLPGLLVRRLEYGEPAVRQLHPG